MTSCKKGEHEWFVLYETGHIKTYRCKKCGKDVYEEKPYAD